MNKFLTKNKILTFIIVCLIILATSYFLHIKNKEYSYSMNIDCSKIASAFVKQQKDNILADSWNVELLQNKYNNKKNSCYGEFRFWSNSGTFFSFSSIYDLTTNQELASDSPFSLLDQKSTAENAEEVAEEYIEIKKDIFRN